jgi:serine O-acetyltransferase
MKHASEQVFEPDLPMRSFHPEHGQGGRLLEPVTLLRISMRLHRAGFNRLARVFKFMNLVLFSALLPPEIRIGERFALWHSGLGVVIHPNTTIGDNVRIYHHVTLAADVPLNSTARLFVGDDVTIGAGALVLGPVTIGERAFIAAGAVVVDDVPPHAVMAGNPARLIANHDGQQSTTA